MNRGALFDRVLIANRGAIACRIARTLKRLGIASVAVYSDADRHSLHVTAADHAVNIGEAPVAQSYLCVDRILAAAHDSGAQAIHPGYGFLAENADFAERCERDGLVFIGPTPAQMRAFGLKHTARRIAEQSQVPLLPGSGLLDSLEDALQAARSIGFPVMLKSTAGGGGIGMQLCRDEPGLRDAFDAVRRLSRNHFADGGVFLEKFVERARHIEVQIFGDGAGQVIALGERDCSLQRRNQKVIEETPAPDLPATVRAAMLATAENLGRAIQYRSAGTVEYIYDADTGDFHFLEVNTRLQVEHGVTEEVAGIDLVEWMVRVAAGEPLDEAALRRPPHGHSIQARVYAEDPARDFQPSSGLLSEVRFPAFARVETWVEGGSEVSPWYDPMIAKIIVHGADRASALSLLERALAESRVAGIETNLKYLRQIVTDAEFVAGTHTTARLAGLRYHSDAIDVLSGGTQTTIQDWPGRSGYWHIGVPPSGPMDELAFRVGNRLLGNPDTAAGLEIAVSGPTLKFRDDTTIALTGAPLPATLDGETVPLWQAVTVRRGQTLTLGRIGAGARSYLLLHGGVEAPSYLGSRATFTLGQFGGHGGRTLRAGDVLHPARMATDPAAMVVPESVPHYDNAWTLRVVHGPHGAPDFFTATDIDTFFSTHWRVHYNSSRTGVRLIGPKPQWAREDGGEAGLHPSNIHDNAYAIGTVDFTGDMPVILGPDGPSLGGFVCPTTVIAADRWKLGQLAAGHVVRFEAVEIETAHRLRDAQNERLAAARIDVARAEDMQVRTASQPTIGMRQPAATGSGNSKGKGKGTATGNGAVTHPQPPSSDSAVLKRRDTREHATGVTYRAAGDRYVLIEYGEMVLDLNLRFRIQALYEWLRRRDEPGVLELTPGVRSLQVHYAPEVLPLPRLMALLEQAEDELEDLSAAEVPSRIVHLPLAWDDSQTRLAISRYAQSVRADAPWCPSNIEFIRRINGLDSEEEARRIVYDASYLVMGLGDVYLSAPVATPVDPRHRLVTTKYNPARTWTPENAVGIGGSYLCIYGMEGPGGYQFVGRTLQMWNRFHVTREFEQPWLLRFFDQIRFFPVEESELLEMREDFPRGRCHIEIEETTFSLARYNRFIAEHQSEISAFKARQQAAFDAERLRWAQAGTAEPNPDDVIAAPDSDVTLNDGEAAVEGQVHGMVWKLAVSEGQQVRSGDPLLVLEFMKTELTMTAESSGRVSRILCREGALVTPGQTLLVIASQD